MATHTNRLVHETSPYLLQHAHNPVDWYPWGEEALRKAKEENKPILVSIGYAACHWCHVMEKESFEDEETAALMNAWFVNIKIDREEGPDLDHIYMDAVQAITGSGGWPLNVFLTPDTKPFYGGTYFPPKPAYNRPSWKEILTGIHTSFSERRTEVDAQSENLTAHLLKSNGFGFVKPGSAQGGFTRNDIAAAVANLLQNADRESGGFGAAPKFPQTFAIHFLSHHYYQTRHQAALDHALFSLNRMIEGGIYDQLGGGFARYATDKDWLVPHFEKMLYDNALLLSVMSEAYQLTDDELYARTIIQTISFIKRELMNPEGGFYCALDADSEGEEGKYYVWGIGEVEAVLGEEARLFCAYYDITERGNWEHTNILQVKKTAAQFAAENGMEEEEWLQKLELLKNKLLGARSQRIRPQLDDKILLGWNALMVTALCKCHAALGREEYKTLAAETLGFLWTHLQKDTVFYHTYKNGRCKYPAFLDDYAYLIQALIHLQEVTSDKSYLGKAKSLLEYVIEQFGEEESGLFFFTNANQRDVIVRKKEVYDGATPSGNAVMAFNLRYLGIIFDRPDWTERSRQMLELFKPAIIKYPGSFGVWADLAQSDSYGIPEIALTGENFESLRTEFLRIFIPSRIFQSATLPDNQFPLLSGKPYSREPQFYLCQNYSCQSPVRETNALIEQLNNV